MKTTEIKTHLHERIEHLSDAQIEKLHDMLNKEFPEKDTVTIKSKKRKLGTMKGKIRMSDDWDSKEVNEEIARTFYEGDIFPKNN